MKHLNFFSKRQTCSHNVVTLAATVGSPSAHRRGTMLKPLFLAMLFLFVGIGNVWGAKDDIIYKINTASTKIGNFSVICNKPLLIALVIPEPQSNERCSDWNRDVNQGSILERNTAFVIFPSSGIQLQSSGFVTLPSLSTRINSRSSRVLMTFPLSDNTLLASSIFFILSIPQCR